MWRGQAVDRCLHQPPCCSGGIAFELALAALLIYAPPFQSLLGTAALTPDMLLDVAPLPFIVWGTDELRRWLVRRHERRVSRPLDRPAVIYAACLWESADAA